MPTNKPSPRNHPQDHHSPSPPYPTKVIMLFSMALPRGGVVVLSTLRIHFTLEDLARTRLAPGPDVLWEIANSLARLQGRRSIAFDRWRKEIVERLGRSVGLLLPLVPPTGYFAGFITLAEGMQGLAAGVDAVYRMPRARLHSEAGLLAAERRPPPWMSRLANADGEVIARLRRALQQYHEAAVEPYWSAVVKYVEADRALRTRAFLEGGYEGLLASLRPSMRWRPPVLEVDYPVEQDLHLGGRGLLLMPSFFCWRTPVALLDEDLQPVLVYPVAKDPFFPAPAPDAPGDDAGRRLGALLGNTRATVLRTAGTPCTTTELSQRAGVSLASASQHATVLREAGLICTQRDGGSVRHSLTALGMALLDGSDV
jgi:DNA-binding transcriptional ArsR family regulator